MCVLAQCAASSSAAPPASTQPRSTVATTHVPAATSTTSTTEPEPTTTTAPAPTTTTTAPAPTTSTLPPPVIDPYCPITPHGAVIDRDRQRAYLCDNGVALPEFVVTTAFNQPDPGVYPVYAKTMRTFSRFGGHYSTMTHFVAFTRGKDTGARVAFHTVPKLKNGQFVEPLEGLGTLIHWGDSSGCIRVLPEQGQVIWDWLQTGDLVHVIT